jgi:hypothetical protein
MLKLIVMKKLLLLVVIFLPFIVQAQNTFGYKVEDRYLYYSDVVKVDTSFTVSDLYKDAKVFFVKLSLPNIKFNTDDDKGGLIIASVEEQGAYKSQTGVGDQPMTLKYTLKLELKKGRYRYTFENIVVNFEENKQDTQHTLYDLDKDKSGGLLGLGRSKRVLKALDGLIEEKIHQLTSTMKKKSDDF